MNRVSVIVPTRNSANTLKRCLLSIRSQTHPLIELIVVDNHSTDRSLDIANEHADCVLTVGPERSAQRNFGARNASGQFLLFVDSDMVVEPNVVAECLVACKERSAPGVIIHELTTGDDFWAKCRALERSCYVGDDLIEAARFFRKDTFWEEGGFDEQLFAGEDWDLSMRVRRGRSLPRIVSKISHDEAGISLRQRLAKKRYYAGSFRSYLAKHPSEGVRQANLIVRPAFFRHWRRLLRHPILACGVITLKAMESAAAFFGLAMPRRRTLT